MFRIQFTEQPKYRFHLQFSVQEVAIFDIVFESRNSDWQHTACYE